MLKRIGISVEEDLLNKFDNLVDNKGYNNRSEALRDMMHDALLQHTWEKDEQMVAGSILLFYNHFKRNLIQEITSIQHEVHDNVKATTHFYIDHRTSLEIIIVKGKAKKIEELKKRLTSLHGVVSGGFTVVPIEHI